MNDTAAAEIQAITDAATMLLAVCACVFVDHKVKAQAADNLAKLLRRLDKLLEAMPCE